MVVAVAVVVAVVVAAVVVVVVAVAVVNRLDRQPLRACLLPRPVQYFTLCNASRLRRQSTWTSVRPTPTPAPPPTAAPPPPSPPSSPAPPSRLLFPFQTVETGK